MTVQPIGQAQWATDTVATADAFGAIGVRMHFASGEQIYAQEESADIVYRLIAGGVRTARFSSDGRRQIGDFYYPGDLFGIETGPRRRFCAEALGECEVQAIKRAALRHHGDEADRFEHALWSATAQELQRAQDHLLLLGRKGACEKVAAFMLDVAERQGGDHALLAMGRQDMADYLGLTIETVSRMLTQLQHQRLVTFTGCRRFHVTNQAALRRLADR